MSALSDMDGLLQDFLTEAGELLDDVDQKLIDLESHPTDADLLNTIFRGFHTIKGGAGFLEAPAMVELCHRTENLFDQLRGGKLSLTAEMLDVILSATAQVKRMMGEMASGAVIQAAPADMLLALDCFTTGGGAPVKAAAVIPAPGADGVDWTALHRAVSPAVAGEQPAAAVAAAPAEAPALAKPARVERVMAAPGKESSLRVDAVRIDRIMDLSGEIGLAKNRLNCLFEELRRRSAEDAAHGDIEQALGQLDTLVSDLQSVVMKTRLQPVSRVFQKYLRMARDLARQVSKDVDLVIEGAETEVDKTILEELNDPLVHLVRNAVDHGIESISERTALGKPQRGTIRLSARQDGDQIIIEIADDGRGMDPEILRRKAVEKGLIAQEEANMLDEKRSLELIFLPGFSTKTQISDLSGRGVGMDVVRTNIQRLKGTIDLESTLGRGSRTTISLPLTLAILPVLMTRIENQMFAIPLSAVREIISLEASNIQTVAGGSSISVRGEVLPVVYLAELLGRQRVSTAGVGVVVSVPGGRCILAVDSVAGQDEVMVKPLEGLKPRGVSGATLSGDGMLVLALDLHELLGGTGLGGTAGRAA
jgi:two-component system chemotaxis sensor kinase CheA